VAFHLGRRSRNRLADVHIDLAVVVVTAIYTTDTDFTVIEGVRTKQRQQELFDVGASKTLNSRHLTGHAVDLAALVNGEVRWDWPLYFKIAGAMKAAAKSCGISIEWGGDWTSFKDGPHFQLPWNVYPMYPSGE